MKRCFMIGHREAGDAIYPALLGAVLRCIEEDAVEEFIVGHYGGFDHLAKRALLEVKRLYPARLTLLLPYYPAPKGMTAGFDATVYPFERHVPPRSAIVRANRAMIDACACLIAYVRHPGNARECLLYAQKHEKKIYRI
jgi:Uncharacterized conserved protein